MWNQGQKVGKSDAFLGLAIVSVSELLATASQRHVVPLQVDTQHCTELCSTIAVLLQGRPYEEDKVAGLLTVEFLFTDSLSVQPSPER